jgi:Protein of unknown function (DUF3102)
MANLKVLAADETANQMLLLPGIGPAEEIALAEHAAVIRTLGKRVVGDVLEIGRRLTEAREITGQGGWEPWLKQEFGWASQRMALNFMRCHSLNASENFSDLNLPVAGLYLLAAPTTPQEARDAILTQARNGKELTYARVKQMIAGAKEKQDAQNQTEREREREAMERKLAKVHEQYAAKEAKLRADLKGAMTPDELQEAIDEALAPYQEKIKRLQGNLKKRKKQPNRFFDSEFGLQATAIRNQIDFLEKALTITTAQMMTAERLKAEAVQRPLSYMLAELPRKARIIRDWLDRFLKEEGVDECA